MILSSSILFWSIFSLEVNFSFTKFNSLIFSFKLASLIESFLFDSSIAPQRFDGPFTSGALYKLRWLTAHRNPYYIDYDNPYRKGNSSILEVPISALFWPFIGSHMRLSPLITTFVHNLLSFEARVINKPIVFLFHPNECLSFIKKKTEKRGNYFSDQLRHSLKMKNLGEPAINLLESIFLNNKYQYSPVCDINL